MSVRLFHRPDQQISVLIKGHPLGEEELFGIRDIWRRKLAACPLRFYPTSAAIAPSAVVVTGTGSMAISSGGQGIALPHPSCMYTPPCRKHIVDDVHGSGVTQHARRERDGTIWRFLQLG